MNELCRLGAAEAVRAMRQGELLAEDYAQALLRQSVANAGLHAFSYQQAQAVLESARALDLQRAGGHKPGRLHGLPLPFKDSINTASMPTSNGTARLCDFLPQQHAEVVERALGAGALILGKTNMHELSCGWTSLNEHFGPVINPHNARYIAGGSSGGAAAAVATRMAPLAIAEDTLGSIRIPASMCGTLGFRPSPGRYPNGGLMPLSRSGFDQIGTMALRIEDLVLWDSVLAGPAGHEPARLAGLRIGVPPLYGFSSLDADVERLCSEALFALTAEGARLVWAEPDPDLALAMDTAQSLILHDTVPAISGFLDEYGLGLTVEDLLSAAGSATRFLFREAMQGPHGISEQAYGAALRNLEKVRAAARKYFSDHQLAVVVLPAVLSAHAESGPHGTLSMGGFERSVRFDVAMCRNAALGTCAGLPSLVLPVGKTSAGVPVGMEFLAQPGTDAQLLSLGLQLEKIFPSLPAPDAWP